VLLVGAAIAVHRARNSMSWIYIKEQKVIKTWMLSISSSKNAGLHSAGNLQFPPLKKGFISEVIDISLIVLKQLMKLCGRSFVL
jgi:hypothetical protein